MTGEEREAILIAALLAASDLIIEMTNNDSPKKPLELYETKLVQVLNFLVTALEAIHEDNLEDYNTHIN